MSASSTSSWSGGGSSGLRRRAACAATAYLLALAAAGAGAGAAGDGYHEAGSIDGAPYEIRIPSAWNGTLILYARGWTDEADDPSESENRTPSIAPDLTIAGDGGMAELLLEQGYGLAGTAYRTNGIDIVNGARDVRNIAAHIYEEVIANPQVRAAGKLDRTILFACSLGSPIAYRLLEEHPQLFDAAITVGGVGAGLPRALDWVLAFQLAYDVAFGWPTEWGQVGDVRSGDDPGHPDDVDWEREALPEVVSRLADPRNFARFEFIRLILGLPLEGFYPGSAVHPGNLPSVLTLALLSTELAAEAERHFRGAPYQNLDHRYRLAPFDRSYLQLLDPLMDADELVAAMNARTTYRASASATAEIERGFGFSGRLIRPVLTLKNIRDGVTPPWHDTLHARDVAAARAADDLLQVYVDAASHCAFTPAQYLAAITAVERWLTAGRRPGADAFPPALGFVPDYSPPAWPFG